MKRVQVRYFYKENNIHGIIVMSKRIVWINTYDNGSNIIYLDEVLKLNQNIYKGREK